MPSLNLRQEPSLYYLIVVQTEVEVYHTPSAIFFEKLRVVNFFIHIVGHL